MVGDRERVRRGNRRSKEEDRKEMIIKRGMQEVQSIKY